MKKHSFYARIALISLAVLSLMLSSCSDDDDPNSSKSSEKQILSFVFEEFAPNAVGTINQNAQTIAVEVPQFTELTALTPTIQVSAKATINPASGVARDFSSPVVYVVTAEDGSTASYTVTVTEKQNNDNPLTLSGSMNANQTLQNRNDNIDYIVDGAYYIEGNALLTIEAGVKIAFTGVDSRISVSSNAGLKIVGSATNPVIFTGPVNNPNKGAWAGIDISSNRADNVWEYVRIINAGVDGGQAVFVDYGAKLSMLHCLIDGSLEYGLYVYGNAELLAFEENLVRNCKTPIYLENVLQTSPMNATNDFEQNEQNYVEISGNGMTIEENLTIPKINVPYYMSSFWISEGVVTIEAGVNFIMQGGSVIVVYENAKLNIEGSALEPVRFDSKIDNPGYWSGIEFYSLLQNSMTHCVVDNAGGGEASIYAPGAKLEISDCVLSNSAGYGFYLNNQSNITHSSVSFVNCVQGNVYNADDEEILDELP